MKHPVSAKPPASDPPASTFREYKGFVFETGHDGSIAILDATGDPLSKTMKFLATASAFLDVVGHAGATLNAADALGLSLSAKNAPLRQKPQTRLSR
jgi:hypothetical protein